MIDTKGLALLMAFVLQELRKAGFQPEEVAQLFSVENIRLGYELQRKADAGRRPQNPPPQGQPSAGLSHGADHGDH